MNLFMPNFYYKSVVDIDICFLKDNDIKYILLDIDDTISPHDSTVLVSGFEFWLKNILENNIKIVLVSNNYKNRVEFIAKKLNLPFIYYSFKPSPLGIIKALKIVNGNKRESALIGDQVFTDILGANIYGITSILVDPVSVKKNFLSKIKRWAEKSVRRSCKKKKNFDNK